MTGKSGNRSVGGTCGLEELYRDHGPRLRAFLRQFLGSVQAAEDVTQETFAQIWQRPNGFDPDKGTLRAYLFGAGRRRAAEWWRQHASRGVEESTVSAAKGIEMESLLQDALERLPEDQRALIWLREIEGQSYEELARILDVPVGTVRSRLFTAREGLRRIWRGPQKKKGES